MPSSLYFKREQQVTAANPSKNYDIATNSAFGSAAYVEVQFFDDDGYVALTSADGGSGGNIRVKQGDLRRFELSDSSIAEVDITRYSVDNNFMLVAYP